MSRFVQPGRLACGGRGTEPGAPLAQAPSPRPPPDAPRSACGQQKRSMRNGLRPLRRRPGSVRVLDPFADSEVRKHGRQHPGLRSRTSHQNTKEPRHDFDSRPANPGSIGLRDVFRQQTRTRPATGHGLPTGRLVSSIRVLACGEVSDALGESGAVSRGGVSDCFRNGRDGEMR